MTWQVLMYVAKIVLFGYLTFVNIDKAVRYRDTTVAWRTVSRGYFVAAAMICGTILVSDIVPGFTDVFFWTLVAALVVAAVEYFRAPSAPDPNRSPREADAVPGGTTLL